jgi:uncharacterized SAM-binding protein YcdF (DUF218 family)
MRRPPTLLALGTPLGLAMAASDSVMRWIADALETALVSTFPVGQTDHALPIGMPQKQRDAIINVVVTLGYRMLADDSPSPLLAQRISFAARIARTLPQPAYLAFSGGTPLLRSESEAKAMLRYADRCYQTASGARSLHGIRRAGRFGILLENRSRTTRENAVQTVRLIGRELLRGRERGRRRARAVVVTVVSNRFHLPRACRTFANVAAHEAPQLRIRCADVPPSAAAAAAFAPARPWRSDGEAAAAGGRGKSGNFSAWCRERSGAPDPREVALLALRELPALALYAWRGWL